MKARRSVRAIAGISVLAAASVGLLTTGARGCGRAIRARSSTTSSPSRRRAPARTTRCHDSEIKVGTIVPTSGPFAPIYAHALDGIKARVAKANAEGELGKRKIELVNVDDAGDAARNITAAQQLASRTRCSRSSPRAPRVTPAASTCTSQKIPVVGWQLGLPGVRHVPELLRDAERQHQEHQERVHVAQRRRDQGAGWHQARHHRLQHGERVVFTEQVNVGGQQDQRSQDRLHQPRHPDGHHRVRFGRRPDQAVGCRLRVHHARHRREHRPRCRR